MVNMKRDYLIHFPFEKLTFYVLRLSTERANSQLGAIQSVLKTVCLLSAVVIILVFNFPIFFLCGKSKVAQFVCERDTSLCCFERN